MKSLRSFRIKPAAFALARVALVTAGACLAVLISGCATSRPDRPVAVVDQDETLKLQIFLDSRNFGPGVVDNRDGEFTRKALALYQRLNPEWSVESINQIQPYRTYTITQEDRSALGTMASEPAEIAKQKKLPYTSLSELVAERFHTTQNFVRKLNPGIELDDAAAGTVVKVPNVARPFLSGSFPSRYPKPSDSVARSLQVFVNPAERMLMVQEGGRIIAAFPITPGSAEHPAPIGEWRIVGAVPWPWFRYDEGVLKRGERTKDFHLFAPGVNSPVGILWAGLNRPGSGIHGTTSPETIGRAGSHGCIRLANWDAATFYTLVGKGTKVSIGDQFEL